MRFFTLPKTPGSWFSLVVNIFIFGGIGLLCLGGGFVFHLDDPKVLKSLLETYVQGPLALPVAILAFVLLAFIGVPQFALIAVIVVLFGPYIGSLYSWLGTAISALIGFELGRAFKTQVLGHFHNPPSEQDNGYPLRKNQISLTKTDRLKRFIDLVGKKGIWASFLVRLVPSAPFLAVNMAAGATPMTRKAFLIGTGLGILPKILMIAFLGQNLMHKGHGSSLQALIGALVFWILCGLVAGWWFQKHDHA